MSALPDHVPPREFCCVIPGAPVSWKRNRIGKGGRVFRDLAGTRWRQGAAVLVRARANWAAWSVSSDPVGVEVAFVFKRPTRRPGCVPGDVWKFGERVRRPTTNRDDVDRLCSLVLDMLADAGVVPDDGAVTDLAASKWWAAEGEEPRVEVRVSEAEWLEVSG